MIKWIKWLTILLICILSILGISAYVTLAASLPELEGEEVTEDVSAEVTLGRDALGQAVIHAQNRADAAFALGVAHAQDRFFQMDLQRRVAAGELSQWLGSVALNSDRSSRFHQFRRRAQKLVQNLPEDQQQLLNQYTAGVNRVLREATLPPFEYLLTGFEPLPWRNEDSILVAYSMYLDLQSSQIELDLARTGIVRHYGQQMLDFLTQPGKYQAALDGSIIPQKPLPIPDIEFSSPQAYTSSEPLDIGSNNWAVTGALTASGSGLLANDMHLGLRVPIIWYRTQLNYEKAGEAVQLTGVSLPGLPGIIVGTNGHIAWGFTNANLDNVDWVALDEGAERRKVEETIRVNQDEHSYRFTMSEYGPVKTIDGQDYALTWVAHQAYAVNLNISDLDTAKTVDDARDISQNIGIPVQNMVVVDARGSAAWLPTGAITGRPNATPTAISPDEWSEQWQQQATEVPGVRNPSNNRIWTANSRVISAADLPRFGDGGYALGARAQQIRDRLFARDIFDEASFYQIQLDNEAKFLQPWYNLLVTILSRQKERFSDELAHLAQWQGCACAESVGYTLVKHFRGQLINTLLSPVFSPLEGKGYRPDTLLRQVEPAIWQLIESQPSHWLPEQYADWEAFVTAQFVLSKETLVTRYDATSLNDLTWGKVNALEVEHPFAAQVPLVGELLNMPTVAGFGDSYMPAVQGPSFGASQRFFVQPGKLGSAVLTLPGGQSGHPLSDFYRAGFDDYAQHRTTPLLPGDLVVSRKWRPAQGPQ